MSVQTVIQDVENFFVAAEAWAKKEEIAVVTEFPKVDKGAIAIIDGFEKVLPFIDAGIIAIDPAATAIVTTASAAAVALANKIKTDLQALQTMITNIQAAVATPAPAPAPETGMTPAP